MRSLLLCVVLPVSACAGGYRTVGPATPTEIGPPVEYVGAPGLEQRLDAKATAPLAVDPLQMHVDHAIQARVALRARLVALGAIPRPPRPALKAEDKGEPPFEGAYWLDGRWIWENGEWEWQAGLWTDGAHDEIYEREFLRGAHMGYAAALFAPLEVGEGIRDHRDQDTWRLRDHRDDPPAPSMHDDRSTTIRDHRDDKQDSKNNDNHHSDDDGFVRIRDHRH